MIALHIHEIPSPVPLPNPPRARAWRSGGPRRRPALRLPEAAGDARLEPASTNRAAAAFRLRLSAFPAILEALGGQEVRCDPDARETAEAYLNRMGTSLMALFRDSEDREAFEALYALTRDSVLAWIKSLLVRGNAAFDPSELLQDTFVNVYRYPRSFRDEHDGSFRVWVRTIAGNLVRRAGTRRARYSFHALPEGLQEPADSNHNPASLAAAADESVLLTKSWTLFLMLYAEAWKDLSQRDRRTLHLVEVEGLSYEEAGEILGVGRSNMKMIVFRSRKRIARKIERVLAAGRLSAAGLEVA